MSENKDNHNTRKGTWVGGAIALLLVILAAVVVTWVVAKNGGNTASANQPSRTTGVAATPTPGKKPTQVITNTVPADPATEGQVMLSDAQFSALLTSLTGQNASKADKATDAAAAPAPTGNTPPQAAEPEEVEAPDRTPTDLIPSIPVLARAGQNIIEVASSALATGDPKVSVFPRVIRGGVYSPDSGREAFEQAVLAGAPATMGTSDFWSVFSYVGTPGDNSAWFFPLTENTADLALLRQGTIQEVDFLSGNTTTITRPAIRLDAMMAVNLVQLNQVGARALTKNPGIISLVLVDGQTEGVARVAFAVPPAFVSNFTGGDPGLVPAIIVNGQPGREVLIERFGANGALASSETAVIEDVNGTLTFEVPSDGGFVIFSLVVLGSNENANTEVLFRMGSQPLSDIEGKNWHPAQ